MQKIEGSVLVYLEWNDDANEWQLDPVCFDGSPLDWKTDPHIYDDDDDYADPTPASEAALQQATDRYVTIEDLAFILGSGVIQQHMVKGAVVPPNTSRPVSRGLIEVVDSVIEGAMNSHNAHISNETRQTLRSRLLPVFASVDENAFRRGKAASQ